MGKTPREKAIYMVGFTFGVGFGMGLLGLLALTQRYTITVLGFTGLLFTVIMVVVSLVWKKRANK